MEAEGGILPLTSQKDHATVRLETSKPGEPLKLKRLLAVDLPVLCSRPMTAVSMLGGLDRLSAACTGKTRKLQFSFRPGDELSIPISSQPKIPASRLLLRVRVRKNQITGQRYAVHTEVVGTVSTTFQFRCLADFQYLTTQAFLPPGTPDLVSQARLEIVPPSFIPVAHAGNYAYVSLKSSALASHDTARRQGVVIRYGCPIPKAPPAMLVNRPRRRSEKYGHVLEKLQALFDRVSGEVTRRKGRGCPCKRRACLQSWARTIHAFSASAPNLPVPQERGGREMWQRKALESQFEEEGLQHAFLELLRVVAYNMSNGPWRGLWVRYGYDPSLDPVARFYQALDVRWKEAGLEKVKRAYEQVRRKGEGKRGDGAAAKEEEEAGAQDGEGKEGEEVAGPQAGRTGSELQLFGLPVRRQMVFQLCDLGGASLQELVLGLPRKALCSPQGGWFRLSDLNRLRVRIKRYLSSRVAECVRTGSLEAVVGPEEGALSSSAMIKEAEARRGREVVWREDDFKKGAGVDRDQEGWPERQGGKAMTRRSSKRTSAGGGGRRSAEVMEGEGGVRRNGKRARRAALKQAEERQDEVSEWEDDRELDGGEGSSLRGGQEDKEGEEDEERGLRHLGDLLGQPMGGIKSSRGDRRTARAGGQSSGGRVEEAEDTDELGGNFVIPLTAGEMENASSIRLLGGYQGGDYSSSSSTEEDEGAESD